MGIMVTFIIIIALLYATDGADPLTCMEML